MAGFTAGSVGAALLRLRLRAAALTSPAWGSPSPARSRLAADRLVYRRVVVGAAGGDVVPPRAPPPAAPRSDQDCESLGPVRALAEIVPVPGASYSERVQLGTKCASAACRPSRSRSTMITTARPTSAVSLTAAVGPPATATRASCAAPATAAAVNAPFDVPLRVSYNGRLCPLPVRTTPRSAAATRAVAGGERAVAGGALVTVQDNGLLEEGSDYSCRFGDNGGALAPATTRQPARVQCVAPAAARRRWCSSTSLNAQQ